MPFARGDMSDHTFHTQTTTELHMGAADAFQERRKRERVRSAFCDVND